MNSHQDPRWAQHDQFTTMSSGIGETDFTDFVNDLDLDISGLEFQTLYGVQPAENHAKPADGLDLSMLHDHNAQFHDVMTSSHTSAPDALITVPTDMFDFAAQMPFDQMQQGGYPIPQQSLPSHNGHNIIPPTPNSVEMHANTARYMQQLDAQSRAILEQHYQMRKADAAAFTPLVSPAVTPHDIRYQLMSDYNAVPANTYFSPLTSPALEGQPQPRAHTGSNSSVATASPVDPDVEMADGLEQKRAVPARRTRKRPNSPRIATPAATARQNAVAKSQVRKKNALTTAMPPKEVQQLLNESQASQLSPTSPLLLNLQLAQQSSGTDSVSPEPLSDALMGPPPKPVSARQSPALLAQNRQMMNIRSNGGRPSPATPASLMRLQSSDSASPLMSPLNRNMSNLMSQSSSLDDLVLPEAATIDSEASGDATPRLAARKTPKLGPLSTPGAAALSVNTTARSTPLASAVTSPISAVMSPIASRKPDSKARAHKKRASMSGSSIVSPALRPKISPSIKPLLPEGVAAANLGTTDDAHTIFLASRSNYQNLIEGTHVPGVSYPTDLSTNLTSKRTSHKIAEQGRRNRINLALQEMLSLLPRSNGSPIVPDASADDDEDEKGGKGGAKGNGGSKAATVESAIEYIKTLQQQSQETREAMEEKDREVSNLKRRLEEMERRLTGVTSSVGTPASSGALEGIGEKVEVDTPA